jgi:hypothetical protein
MGYQIVQELVLFGPIQISYTPRNRSSGHIVFHGETEYHYPIFYVSYKSTDLLE